MKIEDELYLVDQSMVPTGFPVFSKSIRDHDLADLIKKLGKNKIKIDSMNSEQDIEYEIFETKRKSTIPLQVSFGDSVKVVGYTLRNKSLEICLKDYHQSNGTGGKIGGTVQQTNGIHFSLKFDGTYEEGNLLETAKKVLKDFYK